MAENVGLEARVAERQALLERAVQHLSEDRRISAAWLHGSIGSGTHDEWSDLDLWIVVEDAEMESVRVGRHDFAAALGDVLLTIEAPQNAPTGGTYLLIMYRGAEGPQILDCSWQPLSMAHRPPDTLLLFDHVGIPPPECPEPETNEARMRRAAAQTRFVWMMANIVAKYIARLDAWGVVSLVSSLWSAGTEIEWLVGRRGSPVSLRERPYFAPPLTPEEQFAVLRGLLAEMEDLMEGVPELRAAVGPAVVEQTGSFLSLVERQLGPAGD